MSEPDFTQLPDTYKGEVVQTLTKILASGVPIIGPVGAEIIALLIQPQITKRRDEWLAGLGAAVARLLQEKNGPTADDLANNEAFTTAVLHATLIALRTHQQEKRRALRNAVLNVAAGTAPSDDLQMIFLDAIDALTPSHLRLLAFLKDPRAWALAHDRPFPSVNGASTSSVGAAVEWALPEWGNREQFYGLLFDNLAARGFVQGTSSLFGTTMTLNGALSSRTTELGRQFLAFVTAPIEGLDDEGD